LYRKIHSAKFKREMNFSGQGGNKLGGWSRDSSRQSLVVSRQLKALDTRPLGHSATGHFEIP
jgi:hypothetical protein